MRARRTKLRCRRMGCGSRDCSTCSGSRGAGVVQSKEEPDTNSKHESTSRRQEVSIRGAKNCQSTYISVRARQSQIVPNHSGSGPRSPAARRKPRASRMARPPPRGPPRTHRRDPVESPSSVRGIAATVLRPSTVPRPSRSCPSRNHLVLRAVAQPPRVQPRSAVAAALVAVLQPPRRQRRFHPHVSSGLSRAGGSLPEGGRRQRRGSLQCTSVTANASCSMIRVTLVGGLVSSGGLQSQRLPRCQVSQVPRLDRKQIGSTPQKASAFTPILHVSSPCAPFS